jgi:UDP-N-acetylglucosamine 2-epimerase (non-hydrolysing)
MNHSTQPALAIILGTRPEIIKLSPIIRACEHHGIPFVLIHTGQHYSENLDEVFFNQLELPSPDYNLGVGSQDHGAQTGEMLIEIESLLQNHDPEYVLVQGDTNSTLAGAIATSKLPPELGHVEAGLRSFDREMPEEVNRVAADHMADYLFPPTDDAADHLRKELNSDAQVTVTGNTIVDALQHHREIAAEKSTVLADLELTAGEFGLLTAHRAENVDNRQDFQGILDGVGRFAVEKNMEIVYPVHPRAENRLEEFDLSVPSEIRTVSSQKFLDFLRLEMAAAIVFTDSGGVQEETCVLGTPCVTVRDSTERPETVRVGANTITGTDPESIVTGGERMWRETGEWENPFGDGHAARRVLAELLPEYIERSSVEDCW